MASHSISMGFSADRLPRSQLSNAPPCWRGMSGLHMPRKPFSTISITFATAESTRAYQGRSVGRSTSGGPRTNRFSRRNDDSDNDDLEDEDDRRGSMRRGGNNSRGRGEERGYGRREGGYGRGGDRPFSADRAPAPRQRLFPDREGDRGGRPQEVVDGEQSPGVVEYKSRAAAMIAARKSSRGQGAAQGVSPPKDAEESDENDNAVMDSAVVRSSGDASSVDIPLPIVRERELSHDRGTFFSGASWKDLGASEDMVAALRSMQLTRPSHIQAESFRAFAKSEVNHVVLADQAGSGKTLAYLLPIVQRMRAEEAAAGGPIDPAPRRVRAMVLAPTVELAQQVHRVAKQISRSGAPFRVALMTGGEDDREARNKSWRTQVKTLERGTDLLIATPGRALEHVQKGNLELGSCKEIVLDECDVLLGDQAAFKAQVLPLQEAAPDGLRFVLVTATLPQHIAAQLALQFPGLAMAMGPGLHRTASGVQEELVDCSGGGSVSLESGNARKLEALERSLNEHAASRVLVFCNKIENCRLVENYLNRQDRGGQAYKVLAYHEAVREDTRAQNMHTFLKPLEKVSKRRAADGSTVGGELPTVLIATDRMSRGIDCMYCQHVVLFDFPRDPSEYVRRVGRTARGAGGTGVVTALVIGRTVPLAREIMRRNEKGIPVHKLPEVNSGY